CTIAHGQAGYAACCAAPAATALTAIGVTLSVLIYPALFVLASDAALILIRRRRHQQAAAHVDLSCSTPAAAKAFETAMHRRGAQARAAVACRISGAGDLSGSSHTIVL
ncbi:MAG TPA: hypothetical protein VGI64_15740, partial [Streptosporangiaceae bacterium]